MCILPDSPSALSFTCPSDSHVSRRTLDMRHGRISPLRSSGWEVNACDISKVGSHQQVQETSRPSYVLRATGTALHPMATVILVHPFEKQVQVWVPKEKIAAPGLIEGYVFLSTRIGGS